MAAPPLAETGAATGRKPSLWARAGWCYLQAGELKSAARCAESAGDLGLQASVAEAGGDFAGAGRLYERAGQLGEAVRCLSQAGSFVEVARIQLGGVDPVAGAELTLERRLPPAPAVAALERLLRDSPEDAPIRLRAVPALASLLARAGRVAEARGTLQDHGRWLSRTDSARSPEDRARGWLRLAEAAARGGWDGLGLTAIALAASAAPPQEGTRDEVRRAWGEAGGEPTSLPWPEHAFDDGEGRRAARRRKRRERG
ncbi:hypothetical protein L6R50_01790 [Myxococcota bacterium]|nr:hypothetical protein [Myxococcota bacterium]